MVENGLEGKGILASLAPHAGHPNQGRGLASRRLVPGFQGKQGGYPPPSITCWMAYWMRFQCGGVSACPAARCRSWIVGRSSLIDIDCRCGGALMLPQRPGPRPSGGGGRAGLQVVQQGPQVVHGQA